MRASSLDASSFEGTRKTRCYQIKTPTRGWRGRKEGKEGGRSRRGASYTTFCKSALRTNNFQAVSDLRGRSKVVALPTKEKSNTVHAWYPFGVWVLYFSGPLVGCRRQRARAKRDQPFPESHTSTLCLLRHSISSPPLYSLHFRAFQENISPSCRLLSSASTA